MFESGGICWGQLAVGLWMGTAILLAVLAIALVVIHWRARNRRDG